MGILAAVYLSVPGVLGTITSLFTGASEDPSIASRTGSYDIAYSFFLNNPILGRGFGTFLPKYWILDNGYLGLLIEGGIAGLLGLLVLIASAAYSARKARRLSVDEFDRELAQAVLASVCAGVDQPGVLRHLRVPTVGRLLLPGARSRRRAFTSEVLRA